MKTRILIFMSMLVGASVFAQETQNMELTASKDNFARSNHRNKNSGAAPLLLLAQMPSVVSIVAFDLSTVTNEIQSAEFSFRIQESSPTPVSLTVAPMVHNVANSAWIEGTGNLGLQGRNAELGEVTFQWRSFRDRAWEDGKGRAAKNLMDPDIWEPALAQLKNVEWVAGQWITIKIDNASFLEDIRKHELQTVTFGLWGTAGDEAYKVDSKESGQPPKLNLTVNKPEKPVSAE